MFAGNIPGRTNSLSVAIYGDIHLGNDGLAYDLLCVSVLFAFAAILFSNRFSRWSAPQ